MSETADNAPLIIGVSHHCISEYEAPVESIRLARAEGLESVEFFGCDFTAATMREIRRAAEAEGVLAAWHPWLDLAGLERPAQINKRLEQLIDDASAMGARNVVIHMGEAPPAERASYLAGVVEGFALAATAARRAGVRFCVENCYSHAGETLGDRFEDFELLFSAVEADAAGFTLDTGHALIAGGPPNWLERFAGRLAHVHLHSNDAATDLHLPFPEGSLDWEATLTAMIAAGFGGPYNIEFTYAQGGRQLRDLLRRLAEAHLKAY